MKAFLMYRDRDFDIKQELPFGAQDLARDLELEVLFRPWEEATRSCWRWPEERCCRSKPTCLRFCTGRRSFEIVSATQRSCATFTRSRSKQSSKKERLLGCAQP